MEKEIIIYTDGSCLGNPGPGGWGVLIIENDQQTPLSGSHKDTTNNRMEMQAIIEALKYLHKKYPEHINQKSIAIYSDSNLIIQTFKQGWKKKANTDLWAQLEKLTAWLNISWNWVKGHSTNKYNNLVDELAVKAAKNQT